MTTVAPHWSHTPHISKLISALISDMNMPDMQGLCLISLSISDIYRWENQAAREKHGANNCGTTLTVKERTARLRICVGYDRVLFSSYCIEELVRLRC